VLSEVAAAAAAKETTVSRQQERRHVPDTGAPLMSSVTVASEAQRLPVRRRQAAGVPSNR